MASRAEAAEERVCDSWACCPHRLRQVSRSKSSMANGLNFWDSRKMVRLDFQIAEIALIQ